MEQYFFKRLIFIGAALFLGACSAQKGDSTPEVTQLEQLQSAGGLISTPDAGTGTSTGSDVTLTLTLKTNSSTLRTETITLTPESQGFSLLTTSCPNINNTRTCTVRIKFTAAGKANGTYTGAVVVSDLTVPLSLVLNKPVANDLSGLKVGLDAVEDISALDFGTISATGSVTKVLIVKDINKSIKENITITSSSADFTVLTTSCVTTALNSTAGCSVRLQFNGTGKTPGNFAGNLNISTRVIPMTGVLQAAPIFVGTPDVKMLINDVVITQQNFGTINLNEKKAVVIKIKNEGTAASISNYFSVSGSSAFYVTGSSCGSTIQAGGSCQFTLNFNGVNLLSNQVATINYGSTNIQALGEILGNCPVSQHLEGTACVNNIQNETVSNGSRVRSYNIGSSSWGDWTYNCSPTYIPSPSTNSCVPEFIKPNAPIVTLEMSSDQNHLIATSTCRADLYGVFFDLFYEPDNLLPADQYQYPLFVDQTYLHEDLGVRPESICVPTGINNMGLMTVSVEIPSEMREEMVTLHSMIKGALMWDNNRNSDFSEPVSLFVGCPNGEHKENGLCISNLQNETIANGSRERTFDMNSRQWLAWSYICDPNYAEHLDACVLDTYTAQFGTIVNNKTEPCTGTETVSAPLLTCTRDLDGTLDSSLMKCANQMPPSEEHVSPEQLRKPISIPNGTRYESCVAGGEAWTLDEILCVSSDYALSGENCVLDTYTAQFAPLVNTKTQVCSGTETVTQQMSSCVRDLDGVTLDPSMAKCSGQVGQSATYASDYGTRTTTQNINGTLVEECAVGAQVWTLKTLDCNSGYVRNGSVCEVFTVSVSSMNLGPLEYSIASSDIKTVTGTGAAITTPGNDYGFYPIGDVAQAPVAYAGGAVDNSQMQSTPQPNTPKAPTNSTIARDVVVGLQANGDVSSCSNVYVSLTCDTSSLTINTANLLNIPYLTSLSVNINNGTPLVLPYSAYEVVQVSNLSPTNDNARAFEIYNGEMYFAAYNANNMEKLYKINASGQITQMSNTSGSATISDVVREIKTFGSNLIFNAQTGGGVGRWRKMNASGVITTFAETQGNEYCSSCALVIGSELYFSGYYYNYSSRKLMKATATGASRVSNLSTYVQEDPIHFINFNNELYYSASPDGSIRKLYKYSPSTGKVTQMSNTFSTGSDNPVPIAVFNNELYFVSNETASLSRIYKINMAGKIFRVTDLYPSGSDVQTGSAFVGTVFNNELYFPARNSLGQYKMFKINTLGQVTQVSNLSVNDTVSEMIVFDNSLFFSAYTQTGSGLWRKLVKMNASGEFTVISQTSGAQNKNDSVGNFKIFNNELYFTGANASGYSKIYKLKKIR